MARAAPPTSANLALTGIDLSGGALNLVIGGEIEDSAVALGGSSVGTASANGGAGGASSTTLTPTATSGQVGRRGLPVQRHQQR